MNGGELLVSSLIEHGVTTAFCIPGESYLTVLEALRQNQEHINLILNRHESGATFAAEAYAKATGHPGIAFVTRGPGATNASIGLHTAKQDSTPLLLFIGHVPTNEIGKEAFQEIDYSTAFLPLTKKVIEVMRPSEVAEAVSEAMHLSIAGRPGPIAIVLPEDVTENFVHNSTTKAPISRSALMPKGSEIKSAIAMINASKQPVILAGEQINFESAHESLAEFAEATGAGVVTAFRRQDVIAHNHSANLGHFGLQLLPYQKEFWAECDLVIIAGARPDGATLQGYTLLLKEQKVVHIYPDDIAFKYSKADLGINADVLPTLSKINNYLEKPPSRKRLSWRKKNHEYHLRHALVEDGTMSQCLGSLDIAKVIDHLASTLPKQACIVNDSGAFAGWLHRHYRFQEPRSQFAACLGAMGYGVPAAIGVQLARPNAIVAALVGDGGFLMTGQEIVTGVQQKLPFIILLFDNSMYGSIATHQYRRGGLEALYGTVMNSPDFVAIAKAYGAAAWSVQRTEDFPEALQEAIAEKDRPSLIHIKVDSRNLNANGPQMAVNDYLLTPS